MNKKNLLSIAILLIAVAIVIINLWKTNENKDNATKETATTENQPNVEPLQAEEGKPAPKFNLVTLEGKSVKLSDYRGKKVILNFWATWCPPCQAEMPHMQKFYEKNKENGVEILAVNLTSMDKGTAAIRKFVKDYRLTFPILLDKDGAVGSQYQAISIPTSYILDANGVVVKKILGPMDENMLESLVKNIKS
ncbi:peroxiredoxin family protein [Thermoflavimicrobium daqui]|uniref:peroxiredoxin family protein n=1 Tax=Thermoflavimicrobium daqui TaxID=2137476 RepID=UPI00143D5835|nr:TlpA disulfide reductase family protein [Thermoflavimicrobium daqui]